MKFAVNVLVFWIPFGKLRKRLRMRLLHWIYSLRVIRKAKRVGTGVRVGDDSSVTIFTEIGDNVTLNGVKISGNGKVIIGSHTKIGNNTRIISQNHNYESDKLPYGGDYILKNVIIGECVWIGFGTIVLPGAKIGDGAIIQAGSVVHGEIPMYAIAGGNPAKVFAWRDKERYERLRKESSYNRW